MSTGEWVVAVVLILTLGAVLWYAWEARKQATASARMAEETEQARYDSLRPVIDLAPNEKRAADYIKQGLDKALPAEIECRLRNIGAGPALNIEFCMHHAEKQVGVPFKMGALGAGDSDPRGHHLSLEAAQDGRGLKVVRVHYEDVFHRTLVSWREVSLDEDGELVIGPLRSGVSGDTAK